MDDGGLRGAVVTQSEHPQRSATSLLLTLRMVLYFIGACLFLFALVPWAVLRLDVFLPAVDFGVAGRWIGGLVFLVGFSIYSGCAAWLMGRGRGPYIEFDPPKHLVCTGPYRWCRNPVAAAVLITILGEAIFLSSVALLSLFFIGLPVAHAQAVLLEEPLLRRRFGAEYDAYCRRVPRWIPQRPTQTDPAPSS